jgi:hypothetical protein
MHPQELCARIDSSQVQRHIELSYVGSLMYASPVVPVIDEHVTVSHKTVEVNWPAPNGGTTW